MWQVIRHDWRTLRADRTLWAIGSLLAVAIGYGLHNGSAWSRFQRDVLREAGAEEQSRLEALKRGIADADAGRIQPSPFSDPRSASAVGRSMGTRYASMPPAPLGVLAIGQSDLYPYYFKVSTTSAQSFLHNDEIEHPLHLLSGRFDLAFVILYLYPLFILALTYNLISAEKESGTLAMALSQPVTLGKLAAGKVTSRALFLLAVAVVLPLAGILVSGADLGADGAWLRLALWIGVVGAYGAFWFSLALVVNALGGGSNTNAVALAGAWLLFVVLIPSLLNVAVKTLHPVPSRVELIQVMRAASSEASRKGSSLLARYLEDHPELATADSPQADFATLSVVTQEEVERQVSPVLRRFDEQLERQQALVDRYRFLSPAIVAQGALNDIAGTGLERYKHFLRLGQEFHARWRAYFVPRIMRRQKLTAADIDSLPRFAFQDEPLEPVVRRAAAGLAGLVLAAVVVGALGMRLLGRYQVAG